MVIIILCFNMYEITMNMSVNLGINIRTSDNTFFGIYPINGSLINPVGLGKNL